MVASSMTNPGRRADRAAVIQSGVKSIQDRGAASTGRYCHGRGRPHGVSGRPPGEVGRMAHIDGHLVTLDGTEHDLDSGSVKRLLDSSSPFWLNLAGPDPEALELLGNTFGSHPLAVEGAAP